MRSALFLAAFLTLAGASCASVGGSSMRSSASVEPGQTKQQVLQVLGEPGDRQFSGENEALQYCTLSGNSFGSAVNGWRPGAYTVVWLLRGRVTGVTTYRASVAQTNSCESEFQRIDWQKAPNPSDSPRADSPVSSAPPTDSVAALQLAADKGDPEAQYQLATRYIDGDGVQQDDLTALRWFSRAADQGDAEAQYNLGVMYMTGRGALKNITEGYFWTSLAVPHMTGGAVAMARENLSFARARLTPEQIAEADRRIAAWKPTKP